jgi:hypothetical protein
MKKKENQMQNIKTSVKGKTLTLTIDLGTRLGPSKSGKTVLIATTGGNVVVSDSNGAILGLNLYVPAGV